MGITNRPWLTLGIVFCLVLQFQNCAKKPAFEVAESSSLANLIFGIQIGEGNVHANPKAMGQTVLIEDEGFDFTHEVFKGKIQGTYEQNCNVTGGTVFNFDVSKSKEEILASLQGPRDEGCELVPVESYSRAQTSLTTTEISQWNSAMLNKSASSSSLLTKVNSYWDSFFDTGVNSTVRGADGYHGTFVAGLIAYGNPKTQLVTIDYNMSQSNLKSTLDFTMNVTCEQLLVSMEKVTAWLQDPEIYSALVNQPASQVENSYQQLYSKFNISVHNRSYSALPATLWIADMIATDNCFGGISANGATPSSPQDSSADVFNLSQVSNYWSNEAKNALAVIRAFTSARAKVEKARFERIFSSYLDKVLIVSSAGNDSVRLIEGESTLCEKKENEVVIGAINNNRELTDFSNYGNCIDLFMLGSDVISTLPNGVLYIGSGTSFSAPLTSRLISLVIEPQLSLADKLRAINTFSDTQSIVTKDYLLTNMSYDSSEQISRFAKLTATDRQDQQERLRSLRAKAFKDLYEINKIFGN